MYFYRVVYRVTIIRFSYLMDRGYKQQS